MPDAAYAPAVEVNTNVLPVVVTALELATDAIVAKLLSLLLLVLLRRVEIAKLPNRSMKKFMVEISATRTATGCVVGLGSDTLASYV
jgi:hypothetical protein